MKGHIFIVSVLMISFSVGCSKKEPKGPAPKVNNKKVVVDTAPKTPAPKKVDKAQKLPPLTLAVISPKTDGTKTNPFEIKKALKFEDRTLHVIESKVCTFKSKSVCLKADFLTCSPKNGKDLVRVEVLVNNTSKASIKHPLYPLLLELKDGSTVLPSARCPLLRRYTTLSPVKPGMPSYLTVLYEVPEGKTPAFLKYKKLTRNYFFKLTSATP